jgi:hypothetical protein
MVDVLRAIHDAQDPAGLMLARRLLVALASDAATAEPTLHLLRSQYGAGAIRRVRAAA